MKRSDKKGAASPAPLQVQAPQVWPCCRRCPAPGCAAPQAALLCRRCAALGSGCAPECPHLWATLRGRLPLELAPSPPCSSQLAAGTGRLTSSAERGRLAPGARGAAQGAAGAARGGLGLAGRLPHVPGVLPAHDERHRPGLLHQGAPARRGPHNRPVWLLTGARPQASPDGRRSDAQCRPQCCMSCGAAFQRQSALPGQLEARTQPSWSACPQRSQRYELNRLLTKRSSVVCMAHHHVDAAGAWQHV